MFEDEGGEEDGEDDEGEVLKEGANQSSVGEVD